ncbi:MAG: LysR family transcriptional regulator [Clostridiales bacterium]|nr:LysR family transcriptional regulator [Clostridiales bacterium]
MTSKELLYVKTVADEKNISHAARKLYMAQPSLSQSIQRIEDSVGTPLFLRTNTGMTLTFAGECYYRMACQVLKMFEDFEMEISDINNLKTGRIRLGITNHLGTLILPKVMPRYQEICPHVEVEVIEETTARLEQMLLACELDFAFTHTPPLEYIQPQIHYDGMNRDPFVIVLNQEHPLNRRAVVKEGYPYPVLDLKLLKNERFLMLFRTQRIRQITDAVLIKAGIRQPDIFLTLRNFETTQALAAVGTGVTLLPTQYCQLSSAEYHPSFLSIDRSYQAEWELCIASLEGGFLSKADQLFIRIAKEMLA